MRLGFLHLPEEPPSSGSREHLPGFTAGLVRKGCFEHPTPTHRTSQVGSKKEPWHGHSTAYQ